MKHERAAIRYPVLCRTDCASARARRSLGGGVVLAHLISQTAPPLLTVRRRVRAGKSCWRMASPPASQDERKQRRLEDLRCASCGTVFRPARRCDATTCSSACRQRMYRKRVRRATLCKRIERAKQQVRDAERMLAALDNADICNDAECHTSKASGAARRAGRCQPHGTDGQRTGAPASPSGTAI